MMGLFKGALPRGLHSGAWPEQVYLGMGQNPGTPGEPQNLSKFSWDLWMFIPLQMDDYRY